MLASATSSYAFVSTEPDAAQQWYLQQDNAWTYWPSLPLLKPVRVAVIDSGIDATHPEFKGRIADGISYVPGTWRKDGCGHGTFVAGEIAADPTNGVGIAGMAFNAKLLVAKVVTDTGCRVSTKGEVQAIRWAVKHGARIINLSLGGIRDPDDKDLDSYSRAEAAAVEYAWSKGVLVVAAVGNSPPAPTTPWPYADYPAALPHVLGVAATQESGAVPAYSDRDQRYVDLAAPVVQEAINRGILAVAPCIGTDQMGPKRFGPKGKLAFSFGNVAQDEGSAMAQYAWGKGWRKAALATDGVIVYFKDVVAAFKARWTQLGGKVVDQETYHSLGGNDVNNAVSRLNNVKADVVVTSTAGAFGALSTLISGMRSAGNNTPVLNSWAGDGTYWLPKSPPVTNYWFVTFASIFGDDPNPAVNKLAKEVHAGTGGFICGSAAIDGVVTAIKRAGGSTNGNTLAGIMEKFHDVPTLSGLVSFSANLHTVFGRQYRVIRIQDNKAHLVGTVVAKVVPKI